MGTATSLREEVTLLQQDVGDVTGGGVDDEPFDVADPAVGRVGLRRAPWTATSLTGKVRDHERYLTPAVRRRRRCVPQLGDHQVPARTPRCPLAGAGRSRPT